MGSSTQLVPYDASAGEMQLALENVPTIGRVEVARSGPFGNGRYEWSVTFRGNPGDITLLAADADQMTGTASGVNVVEIQPGNSMSLNGSNPSIRVEEQVGGLPTYTGRYAPVTTGIRYVAV